MDYLAVKHLHVSCVVLSISLFALRGGMELSGIAWRQWRALRIAPHVIDTVLLGSAIWMAVISHQYPVQQAWLTAKLIGLLAYIALGKLALSPRTPPARRPAAFIAALLAASYIVGVALTRSPTWHLFAG